MTAARADSLWVPLPPDVVVSLGHAARQAGQTRAEMAVSLITDALAGDDDALHVKLPPQDLRRLDNLAAATGHTPPELVAQMVRRVLERRQTPQQPNNQPRRLT